MPSAPATDRLVVVSDLHLAPNLPASSGLAGFLEEQLRSAPCHLVIAGDLFDVLAAADPSNESGFDPDGAPQMLRKTVSAYAEVFSCLVRLAEGGGWAVTVLGGNHDVEIGLPTAQLELRSLLGPHVRWLVHGEATAVIVGGAKVVIEHGDLYDDWNRVDYGPLAVAARLQSRGEALQAFDPPPGSRVVTRFLNQSRAAHRWLEWIKPETALVPLLHSILSPRERLRLLNLVGAYVDRARNSVERGLLRFRGPGRTIRSPGRFAAMPPRQALAGWYREALQETTRRSGTASAKLQGKLQRIAANDGFFDPAIPDPVVAELRKLRRLEGAQLIILGHTHAAKAIPISPELLYMNSGAWCPLIQLPNTADAAAWTTLLDALSSNTLHPAWRATYVEVTATQRGCEAQLREWTAGPARVLSRWLWNQLTFWSQSA